MSAQLKHPTPVAHDAVDAPGAVTVALNCTGPDLASFRRGGKSVDATGRKEGPTVAHCAALCVDCPTVHDMAELLRLVGRLSFALLLPGRFPGQPVFSVAQLKAHGVDLIRTQGFHIAPRKWIAANPTTDAVPRDGQHMAPSAWLVIDRDVYDHTPIEWRIASMAEYLRKLDEHLPGLAAAARVEIASTSSRVRRPDGSLLDPARAQAIIQLEEAGDRGELAAVARNRLIVGGAAWTVEQGGRGTIHTPVDFSTWRHTQPLYCGKPTVTGEGWTVDDLQPRVLTGGAP